MVARRFLRPSTKSLLVLLCAVAPPTTGCSDESTTPNDPSLLADTTACEVLMIGNSLTASNDMPGILQELADSSGAELHLTLALFPGRGLRHIVEATNTLGVIRTHQWEYVVIQGGNYEIAFPEDHHRILSPIEELAKTIQSTDPSTEIIFFLDWSMSEGVYCGDNYYTFHEFQEHLRNGTLVLANQMGFAITPYGVALSTVIAERPNIELYHYDDIHPSHEGSYLQACVFYSVIFQRPTEGISVHRGLPIDVATYLQEVASSTVLDSLEWWNIDPY